MPSFFAVCQRILTSPDAKGRLVLGGILSLVPLLNILSMGYALQYARRVRSGHLDPHPWVDLTALLRDGLYFLLIALVWTGIPAVIGLGITMVLQSLFHLTFLGFIAGTLAWLPLTVALAVALPHTIMAVLRFAETAALSSAMDFTGVTHTVRHYLPMLTVPTLAAYGILAIGWPLCGFAAFIAIILLIAYYTLALQD